MSDVESRIMAIDNRLRRLSITIDNNPGQSEGLEVLYNKLMDERDALVQLNFK